MAPKPDWVNDSLLAAIPAEELILASMIDPVSMRLPGMELSLAVAATERGFDIYSKDLRWCYKIK